MSKLRYWLYHDSGIGDDRMPRSYVGGLLVRYSWGWDVRLTPWLWLTRTYARRANTYYEGGYCYVSSDATPEGAWFFLWGRHRA